MRSRNAGALAMLLGLVLLSTPLYWQELQFLAVDSVLDPVAAIGVGSSGWYPATVGGAATAVGAAVIVVDERPELRVTIVLTGAFIGVLIGVFAALIVASMRVFLAVQIGFAGAAPGFAAVSGAATEWSREVLGVGLVVLSLVPLVGSQLLRGVSMSGLAGGASLILATILIVYTAVLAYPFYRLGRSTSNGRPVRRLKAIRALTTAMASTPPGPSGLPMFGSSLQYAEDPFRFLAAIERAYGNVAKFRVGPETIYVVCDPAGIEQILVANADRYRKPRPRDDAIEDLLGNGLLLSDGESWDRQRRLARPAFSPERLTGLADRITAHVDSRIADWQDGDVVDVEREMTRITLDVTLDLMLGVQLPDSRLEEIEAQLVPLGSRFQPNPIRFAAPSWVPVPGDREFDTAIDSLETVIDEIVAAREDTAGDAEGPMDLLSVLLRARNNGEVGHEQLRDEVMTILLAGHDTTALTLTYTWFLLSEHPAAREQVTREVVSVVGGETPGADHVEDFEYVERVLDEAMRLYPPVYTVFREPRRNVTVSGYELQGGSMVMLPQWAVHRSNRFYEDPETFAPDRWRPERASDRPRFAYFPFGGGPRHCIGKHLAMLEAKLILARIATQYELEYLGPTPLELLPSLTAHPKQEMRMRVRERLGSR